MVNYSTSAAVLLALVNLTSTAINADSHTKTFLRRNAVVSKSGKRSKDSKTSKDGSMRMLLDAFEHPLKLHADELESGERSDAKGQKRLFAKSLKTAKEGSMRMLLDAFDTRKLDTAELEGAEFGERSDAKALFAESVKAGKIYHTDVSMIDPPKSLMAMPTMFDMKAQKRQGSRALYSWGHETTDVQTECEEVVAGHPEVCVLVCTKVTSIMNDEKLVDEYSRLSQHKCDSEDDEDRWQSGGSGSGSGSAYSKSNKSKSSVSGSGSDSGSKSSKHNSGGLGSGSGSVSKSSKATSGVLGLGSGSKGSKSAGDWGTTIARIGPNEWESASWSNGYGIIKEVSVFGSTPTHFPTYNPTEYLDNDETAGGYGDVVDGKVSTPTSVFPQGHPLAELSGYAAP